MMEMDLWLLGVILAGAGAINVVLFVAATWPARGHRQE